MCHLSPGTSKWNKVEHRLFSFISSNWRGEPLRDYQTVVGLGPLGVQFSERQNFVRTHPHRAIHPTDPPSGTSATRPPGLLTGLIRPSTLNRKGWKAKMRTAAPN